MEAIQHSSQQVLFHNDCDSPLMCFCSGRSWAAAKTERRARKAQQFEWKGGECSCFKMESCSATRRGEIHRLKKDNIDEFFEAVLPLKVRVCYWTLVMD